MNTRSPLPADNCAAEPIQFSGAIQPHGYLAVCELPDWTIRHVSTNIETLFETPPTNLLGATLRDYLTDDLIQAIGDVVQLAEPGAAPIRAAVGNVGASATLHDISVHVNDGLVHLEFEPRAGSAQDRAPTGLTQAMIARVATSVGMDEFFQRAAQQMRGLTGHDRVLVYRFLDDGAGEVIAEAKSDDIDSLMGLRFPESDIPAQARALYVKNRLRVIPDTRYTPVPIVPGVLSSGQTLDLSFHHLRSVSPMHLQYSRNMGVVGSMSVSIISGGRLWGLFTLHHRTPRPVTATVRAAAALFGLFISMRVSAEEQQRIAARDDHAREVRESLWRALASTRDLDRALAGQLEAIAQSLACDGVALMLGGHWHHTGHTVSRQFAPDLLAWLDSEPHNEQDVLFTDSADDWNAEHFGADGLAGLLAMRLGRSGDWLLFFRDEQVEHVSWAGEPNKPVAGEGDALVMRPRERFDAWREVIYRRSAPWSDLDRRMAERLRQLLREFRRRATIEDFDPSEEHDADRRRQLLREQKNRLEQLSVMLDGLVHLDEADTRRLGDRIALLEIEMRALAAKPADAGAEA
jgi:light-regulated signal transduction histidine kinase (bacteriophytochrome)